ncbi:MAG: alpha/beta hydrolase [Blautia sp.]|nr:alpha/beta hydrolase [Blautia sp.]
MDKIKRLRRILLITFSAVAAVCGVFAAFMIKIFRDTFLRKDPDPNEETDPKTAEHYRHYHKQKREALPKLNSLPMDKLEIVSSDGITLRGRLYHVKDYNKKVVIAFHGFHASGVNDMARFVNMYERQGYDFLIISQRAHEFSDGKYITFGVKEHQDGIRWARKIIDIYGDDVQIVIHGLSMGGATVLMMSGASTLPANVKCCVADCPYDNFANEADYVFSSSIKADWLRKLMVSCMSILTTAADGFKLYEASPIDSVKHALIPILFIHGTGDDFVPCSMGQHLYEECTSPKEQFLVEGAAHVCSYTVAPEEYEKHFEEFCRKYI